MSLATPASQTEVDEGATMVQSITPKTDRGDEVARSREERQLVRKLDLFIMPITYLLYIFAYLDRSNLGNAKLQGLETSLFPNDTSGNQFALLSAMFYIAFLSWQIPLTLAAKRFPPNLVIGFVAVGYGIACSLQAASFSYAGITTTRYFLGLFEAGYSPVVPFYYTFFYLKSEHGFRTSLYVSGAPLASAFGGLIAYGVQHIRSYVATWRILFLVEGLPTILVGSLAFLVLPSRPETTKRLNETERKLALSRLRREVAPEGNEINWKHVIVSLADYKAWIVCLIYQSLSVALASISVFLPSIIKSLGYTDAKAQIMTVPPYACACIVMIVVAKVSDRLNIRGPFVAAALALSGIGYTILLTVPTTATKVRYGAIILAVTGTYSGFPVSISWTVCNAGSETRRAVNMAMLNTIGQCMSILGSYIYPSHEGPAYIRGFSICCGFAWWGVVLAISLSLLLGFENRRRDSYEGKLDIGEEMDTSSYADKAKGFRYVL
ncbi:MFS general substrate transporter [Rhizoctonia solani 123E]|uniref:MFS general substrate transporter n=1 Tax=Rhizoctonia solani 123E TaxID=1423351 RepID=A0A074SD92_9AGAM|nr:MFS general substrate transporter [Rhizoctonia solani 123E]